MYFKIQFRHAWKYIKKVKAIIKNKTVLFLFYFKISNHLHKSLIINFKERTRVIMTKKYGVKELELDIKDWETVDRVMPIFRL